MFRCLSFFFFHLFVLLCSQFCLFGVSVHFVFHVLMHLSLFFIFLFTSFHVSLHASIQGRSFWIFFFYDLCSLVLPFVLVVIFHLFVYNRFRIKFESLISDGINVAFMSAKPMGSWLLGPLDLCPGSLSNYLSMDLNALMFTTSLVHFFSIWLPKQSIIIQRCLTQVHSGEACGLWYFR